MPKPKLTIIYFFYSECFGEVEGMFDTNGNMLDCWMCNDATWRNEYFSGFMSKLGYTIKPLPEKFHESALKKIADSFGWTDEDR